MEDASYESPDATPSPRQTLDELLRMQYESGDVAFSEAVWQAALALLMSRARLN